MTENNSFLPGDDIHEDVEGHRLETFPDPVDEQLDEEPDEQADERVDEAEEDVAGHVQPPRDLDIERF